MSEQPLLCVGCEGNPVYPNDPCAVCGLGSVQVERLELPALDELSLRVAISRRWFGEDEAYVSIKEQLRQRECQLLSAQSCIMKLERYGKVQYRLECTLRSERDVAEAERDRLKIQLEESRKLIREQATEAAQQSYRNIALEDALKLGLL